jgi:hypothetical protein
MDMSDNLPSDAIEEEAIPIMIIQKFHHGMDYAIDASKVFHHGRKSSKAE